MAAIIWNWNLDEAPDTGEVVLVMVQGRMRLARPRGAGRYQIFIPLLSAEDTGDVTSRLCRPLNWNEMPNFGGFEVTAWGRVNTTSMDACRDRMKREA
jgi:hypothetical protein